MSQDGDRITQLRGLITTFGAPSRPLSGLVGFESSDMTTGPGRCSIFSRCRSMTVGEPVEQIAFAFDQQGHNPEAGLHGAILPSSLSVRALLMMIGSPNSMACLVRPVEIPSRLDWRTVHHVGDAWFAARGRSALQ